MPEIPAYVLAGGRSSRFGSDKARADCQGVSLVQHVARALAPVASRVTVVAAQAGQYADLGLRTIADARPGQGPLAGLQAALQDLKGQEWLFLTACDFVGFQPGWITSLASLCGGDHQAVAYRHRFWEPLFACYHVSLLPEIAASLAASHLALWQLLESARTLALPPPAGWEGTSSINDPCALDFWVSSGGS